MISDGTERTSLEEKLLVHKVDETKEKHIMETEYFDEYLSYKAQFDNPMDNNGKDIKRPELRYPSEAQQNAAHALWQHLLSDS